MKKFLWIGFLILILITTIYLIFNTAPETAETNSAPSTFRTNAEDFEIIRYGTGYVEPIESLTLYFQTNGVMANIPVALGEIVERDQQIALLDTENQELAYQKAYLNWVKLTASSELSKINLLISQTQLKLEDAQKDLEIVIAGPSIEYYEDQVSNAYDSYQAALDRIAKLKDPAPQLFIAADNAFAQIEIAEEALTQAKAYVVPQENIDRALAEVNLIQNTIFALQTMSQYISGVPLSEMSNPVISKELIDMINAEWDLAKAQNSLSQSLLISPINGIITEIYSIQGANITTNTPIAKVTAESEYQVRFYLDQSDFGYVSIGDITRIYLSNFSDQTLTGTITRIEPTLVNVDGISKIQVWSSIDQIENISLGYGTSVEIEVIAVQKENVIMVPMQALITNESGEYQVIVLENGQPYYKTVTIAENDYTNVIIESGLTGGETISIDPQSFIEDES